MPTRDAIDPRRAALSEVSVRARNFSRDSANKIHDDAVARTYGYRGGLVAGTTVYAYLTRPLVAAWGLDWLERGTARLALRRPVYDGEPLTVTPRVLGRSGSALAGEVVVEVVARAAGEPVAVLLAGLAWGAPPVLPDPVAYPAAPLPAHRPAADVATLGGLDPLGAPVLLPDPGAAREYAREVDDPLDVYAGPEGAVHPGLVLQQANHALAENVTLGPWVHVESDVAHGAVARVGDRLETRGRVVRLFEKKGHRFVELDLLIVAAGARPVAHVRHTAIYALRRSDA